MHGSAIAAEALGRDGLGLLARDFGGARLAGIVPAEREPRSLAPRADGIGSVGRTGIVRATRP